MFTETTSHGSWSAIGLRVLIGSVIAVAFLSFADGVIKGLVLYRATDHQQLWTAISIWVMDFRYLFEQGVYAATIFFVGAKFFETRTILTIGFDKLDKDKVSVNGPDETNTVWIGHRYNNRLEAEAIADAFRERLRASA
jgi:hypothetical protein